MKDEAEENLLSKLSDFVPGMLFQFRKTSDGHISLPYSSAGICQIWGIGSQEVSEDVGALLGRVFHEDLDAFIRSIHESAESMKVWNHDFRIHHEEKGVRWLRGAAKPEKRNDGSVLWHGHISDVTEAILREQEILKTNRHLSVANKVNEMVLHCESREEIFKRACEIAISHGCYGLAWIGLHDPVTHELVPVAATKEGSSYLIDLPKISVLDNPQGQGPSGTAFREKRTVVCDDIKNSPIYFPWQKKAESLGFRSSIALPIMPGKAPIGTFNIYALHPHFFEKSEKVILEEITRNLSFALGVLETKIAVTRNEEIFRAIFEEAPIGLLLANSFTGEIYQINDNYLELLKRPRGEVIGTKWMKYTHPDDLRQDLENVEALRTGQISGFKSTKRYLRPDGSIVWAELRVVNFGNDGNGSARSLVSAMDVTERGQRLSQDKG